VLGRVKGKALRAALRAPLTRPPRGTRSNVAGAEKRPFQPNRETGTLIGTLALLRGIMAKDLSNVIPRKRESSLSGRPAKEDSRFRGNDGK
jgi:hypothetical protein